MFEDIIGTGKQQLQLQPDVDYMVRLTRLTLPEPNEVYRGKVQFHIQWRANGEIGVLAIKNFQPWAEYCEEDKETETCFICEDYMMEIL